MLWWLQNHSKNSRPSPSLLFFCWDLRGLGVFLSDGHILALGDGSQSFCQIGVEDIVAWIFAVEMPTSCRFCSSTMMLIHDRECKSFVCRVFLPTSLTCFLGWVLLSSHVISMLCLNCCPVILHVFSVNAMILTLKLGSRKSRRNNPRKWTKYQMNWRLWFYRHVYETCSIATYHPPLHMTII